MRHYLDDYYWQYATPNALLPCDKSAQTMRINLIPVFVEFADSRRVEVENNGMFWYASSFYTASVSIVVYWNCSWNGSFVHMRPTKHAHSHVMAAAYELDFCSIVGQIRRRDHKTAVNASLTNWDQSNCIDLKSVPFIARWKKQKKYQAFESRRILRPSASKKSTIQILWKHQCVATKTMARQIAKLWRTHHAQTAQTAQIALRRTRRCLFMFIVWVMESHGAFVIASKMPWHPSQSCASSANAERILHIPPLCSSRRVTRISRAAKQT